MINIDDCMTDVSCFGTFRVRRDLKLDCSSWPSDDQSCSSYVGLSDCGHQGRSNLEPQGSWKKKIEELEEPDSL